MKTLEFFSGGNLFRLSQVSPTKNGRGETSLESYSKTSARCARMFTSPFGLRARPALGFTTAFLFVLLAGTTYAAVVAVHSGQNNPMSEGWTADGNGGTQTAGNDGTDYWQVSTPTSKYHQYNHSLSEADVSGDWSATAVVRPVAPINNPGGNAYYPAQNTMLTVWDTSAANHSC